MSRKPYDRTIPPLESVLADFRPFTPEDNHTARTVATLRAVVERVRQPNSAPFYSMRAVADFLNVPYRTVSIAYERLQAEGMLTRIRGSHTQIEGTRRQPRNAVRGVVGIPVYLPPLLIGNDWRDLLIAIEDQLRQFHFVTDFVIYRRQDQESEALTERMIEHDLDLVLWYAPSPANIPTMMHLLDRGVELVVVSDGKARFPREQYFLDIESSIAEGLEHWQQSGIKSVTLLQSPGHPSRHATDIVLKLLAKKAILFETITAADDEIPELAARLGHRSHAGVIMTSHTWYEHLCGLHPQVMVALFNACRVFLTQGPPYSAYLQGKPVFADSISLPNAQMAARIAKDIHASRATGNKHLATFRTAYVPRVNLGTISRNL
jgi:hypothetical protein